MANKKLADWIKKYESKWYSEEQLYGFLVKKGFSKQEIDDAINPSAKLPSNILDKIKYVFSDIDKFFETFKWERGITNAFLTVLGFSSVSSALSFGMIFFSPFGLRQSFGYGYFFGYSSYLIIGIMVLNIILGFAYAGIVHALIKAFKGTGGYAKTYQVYAYSLIPAFLISLVPLIGWLSIIYSIILMIIGLSKIHNISKGYSALAIFMPILLVLGILAIFLFYYLRYFFRIGI